MEPQSQEHPSSPQIDLLDSSSPSRKTTSESYDDDDDPLVHSVSRNLSSDTPSVKSLSLTPEERNTPRSATGSPVTRTSRQQRSNTASFIGHQLTSSTCFYDIPVNDAFSELLERYVPSDYRPQREISGWTEADKNKPGVLTNLVMNNLWRSVARYARYQIIQTNPADLDKILELWYIRLLALTQLGLHQLASAEFEKLGDLDRPEYYDHSGSSMVPFELRVLWARLPAAFKRPLVSLERITMLVVYCKKMQLRTDKKEMWRRREGQMYLVLATQMMEMNDYAGAASTLETVLKQFGEDVDILSGLGRLYLQLGDIETAEKLYRKVEARCSKDSTPTVEEAIRMNRAFVFIARGHWNQAREILEQIIQANKDNLLAINNLAVCEVYLGHLSKAIELLSNMTTQNPTSAGTCETAILNICTLYELRYDPATEKKIEIMKQVARWVGDSFQAECIKLQ